MSKIDPFAAVLTFLIENSFPKCMNVEVQLLPDCAFWLFLCSISSTFTTSRADIPVLLSNACVREIFADSWSICESRTHTTSTKGKCMKMHENQRFFRKSKSLTCPPNIPLQITQITAKIRRKHAMHSQCRADPRN